MEQHREEVDMIRELDNDFVKDLVLYRKEGKTVYYSLDDDHVRTVLEQGTTHIRHKYGYEED